MSWTKGPWTVLERISWDDRVEGWDLSDERGVAIALVRDYRFEGDYGDDRCKTQEANFRLIAKSPRMAEYIEKKAREGDGEARQLLAEIEGEAKP